MLRIFFAFVICLAIFIYIMEPQALTIVQAQFQTLTEGQTQTQSQGQTQTQAQTQGQTPIQISIPGLTSTQIQAHMQAQAQAQAQVQAPIPSECSEHIIYGPCKNMYGLEMNKETDCEGNTTGIEKGVRKITYKNIPGIKCPEPSNIGCSIKCDVDCVHDGWKNVGDCKINRCNPNINTQGEGTQTQFFKVIKPSINDGNPCLGPTKEVPCTKDYYIGCTQCGGEYGGFTPGATCDNIKSCEDVIGVGERIDKWSANSFTVLPYCITPADMKVPCRTGAEWPNCTCKNDMSDNSFCNETNTICNGASSECIVDFVHREALPQVNGTPGICPEEKKNPRHKDVNLHKCTCTVERNIGTWTYTNPTCDLYNPINKRSREITITKKGGNRACLFPKLSNNEKLVETDDNKIKGTINPNGQLQFGVNNDNIESTFKTIETEDNISYSKNPNCIM
jgi:hypothetical protein